MSYERILHLNVLKWLDVCYTFCWVVYLNCPNCSSPMKSTSLLEVTMCLIWSPVAKTSGIESESEERCCLFAPNSRITFSRKLSSNCMHRGCVYVPVCQLNSHSTRHCQRLHFYIFFSPLPSVTLCLCSKEHAWIGHVLINMLTCSH